MKSSQHAYIWLIPCLCFLVIIDIIPFFYILNLSFRAYSLIKPQYHGQFIGLNNYREALNSPEFMHVLGITTKFLLPAITLEFILGLGIALLLAKEVRGSKTFLSMLIIPMMIAPVVVGLAWRFMLRTDYGILGIYIKQFFGLAPLGSFEWALPTLILVDVWEWTPFIMLILYTGIVSLPEEPIMAAKVDGASKWQIFKYITLPMLRMLILIALLLRIIDAFKDFDKIWILTSGGPGASTELASIYAYRMNFKLWNMGYGASVSLLIFLVIFSICAIFFNVYVKWESSA